MVLDYFDEFTRSGAISCIITKDDSEVVSKNQQIIYE